MEQRQLHKKVISFIKLIRNPAPRKMCEIFTMGGCYQFYRILKQIFPEAIPYKTANRNYTFEARGDFTFPVRHVVSKIGDRYYDIRGEFKLEKEIEFERIASMDDEDIRTAEKFKYPVCWP